MTADRENVNPTNKKEPGSVIVRNITLALDHLPLGGKNAGQKSVSILFHNCYLVFSITVAKPTPDIKVNAQFDCS